MLEEGSFLKFHANKAMATILNEEKVKFLTSDNGGEDLIKHSVTIGRRMYQRAVHCVKMLKQERASRTTCTVKDTA